MKELIRSPDIVLISALSAALTAEGIESFEFDGEIANTYGSLGEFPRRLMVREEDHGRAEAVARALCPEHFT